MANRNIETRLTVRAVDRLSNDMRKMGKVTGRFADGVRSDMARLQKLRGPVRLIEDFRKSREVMQRSGASLEAAREKVRRLQHAITTTKHPTQKMRSEFDRARASAKRLAEVHDRQRRKLAGLQTELRQAGIKTSRLRAEENRLRTAMQRTSGAMQPQIRRLERIAQLQGRIARGRARMDRTLATAGNLALAGHASTATGQRILRGVNAPVSQAIDFETAMADVRKVVDFDTPDGFKNLSRDVLELSTRIPMAASGLAEIVAAGGQSGIATQNLTRFAEMAAKIGVAFDISAGLSGESMAKIKTALDLSLDDTGLLFDAINHLSNKMASEAPNVLDFVRRTGSTALTYGFDPAQTAAFGSAMIAAGSQSDVAATSFRNMGKALTKGEAATKAQNLAFARLGLKATDVAKAMQQDAVGTTIKVIEKLRELPDHVRASTISQLFGDEARAISPLIGNLDKLREALGHVASSEIYAGSAEAEYSERAKTTQNNLELTRNHLSELGITMGELVLPTFNAFLKLVQSVVKRISKWAKEHPTLTKALLIGTAAVGGLAVAGGVLLTAAAGLIATLAVLRFGLGGLAARSLLAGNGIAGLAGRMRGVSGMKAIRWSRFIPKMRWASLLPKLSWRLLITPLKWGLRFIPVIGWVALAGELLWHALIKPLGWDKYLPSIEWETVFGAFSWDGWIPKIDWAAFTSGFAWPAALKDVDWLKLIGKIDWAAIALAGLTGPIGAIGAITAAFTGIDLTEAGRKAFQSFWDGLKALVEKMVAEIQAKLTFDFKLFNVPDAPDHSGAPAGVGPNRFFAQQRAKGGSFNRGPLLVGEEGPELSYASRSGFIAHHGQLQKLAALTDHVRRGAAATLLAGPMTAGAVMAAEAPGAGSARGGNVIERIEISVTVPPGQGDPAATARMIGDSLADELAARFSD